MSILMCGVGNCPSGELSVWGIVLVGNCPSGELSSGELSVYPVTYHHYWGSDPHMYTLLGKLRFLKLYI